MRGHTKFAIVLIILGTILIVVLRSLTANNAVSNRSDASRVGVPIVATIDRSRPFRGPDNLSSGLVGLFASAKTDSPAKTSETS